MYLPIFSKRHKIGIEKGMPSLSLTANTKRRILYAMNKANIRTGYTDLSGWHGESDLVSDLGQLLCEEHGWASLMVYSSTNKKMQKVKIREFVENAAPNYIFDAIELYSRELPPDSETTFQAEINKIFTDSRIPWRLSESIIFRIDSEYMAELLDNASKLLSTQGFDGAVQEFQKARAHIDSNEFKEVIHHANLALESTMKSILGIKQEKPGKLIRLLMDSGIIPSYYDDFLNNFEQILRTVNIARNQEPGAGHGQGAEVASVAPHLAEMVLNFCGSLIVFLTKHHIDHSSASQKEAVPEISDDDIPF